MVVIDGKGLFPVLDTTAKVTVFEVPPPGPGFVTVMLKFPVESTSAAAMEAVS